MAKNDSNRSGRDRDDDADEMFPKYIAGVKVPKALRDQGRAAAQLAQSPLARELLTAGLAAAAAAVVANDKSRQKIKDAGQGAVDAAGDVAAGASRIGAAIVNAASEAAQRFFGLAGAEEEPEPAPRRRAAPKRKPATRAKAGDDGRMTDGRPSNGRRGRKSTATRASASQGTRAKAADGDGAEAPKRRSAAKRTTGGRGNGSATARRANAKAAAEGKSNPRESSAAQAELGRKGGEASGGGGDNGGGDNAGGNS